jgi:hypothetical protein
MAISVTHAKVSAIADDPTAEAAGEVVPSDWNDGHVITGTSGSVPFIDSGGNLAEDNTNFYYDNATDDLHIGGAYYIDSAKAVYTVPHAFTDNWFMSGAGNATLTGQGNIGIGEEALRDVTTGTFNMALGATALQKLTTGSQNTAIGASAGQFFVTSSGNTAIGANAIGDRFTPSLLATTVLLAPRT